MLLLGGNVRFGVRLAVGTTALRSAAQAGARVCSGQYAPVLFTLGFLVLVQTERVKKQAGVI